MTTDALMEPLSHTWTKKCDYDKNDECKVQENSANAHYIGSCCDKGVHTCSITGMQASKKEPQKQSGIDLPAPYLFTTSGDGRLTAEQVVTAMAAFMRESSEHAYKVTIGSDSEAMADKRADFVTAIVIHRVGNGGIYFYRRIVGDKKFHTLRDRIYTEVLLSLEIAHHFLRVAKEAALPHFDFEIHVDVGTEGATRSMLQELVGMIRANNFVAKTKPDSYAASKVADRHGMKND